MTKRDGLPGWPTSDLGNRSATGLGVEPWGQDPELRPVALSYSTGSGSEWMIEAIIQGVIPRPPKLAVFMADTGGEHSWSYRHADEVEARCRAAGITFFRVCRPGPTLVEWFMTVRTSKNGSRYISKHPPFYIDKGDGQVGRVAQQCSEEFKTIPIRRMQRKWLRSLGYRKPWGVTWIGFGADEPTRVTKAVAKKKPGWVVLDFPAFRLGMTRAQQKRDLIEWTGRAPMFSCCVYCPHKTNARWGVTEGADADLAIKVDEGLRDMDVDGLTDGPAYLSNRLIPVSQLVRKSEAFAKDEADPAGCDGGACFV